MARKPQISRKRSLAKAVTWRIVGTTDTTILGWIFTGNPLTGLKIGFTEVITKTILYYLHERAWTRVNLRKEHLTESRKRHLAKTITWRFFGTLDTIILAWIITGDPLTGLHIGATELVTKMVLYYLHERVWYRVNYGLKFRTRHFIQKGPKKVHNQLSRSAMYRKLIGTTHMSKVKDSVSVKQHSYALKDTVLVVGAGRSGTTWLVEVMNQQREYRVVFEPFFRKHSPRLRKRMQGIPYYFEENEKGFKSLFRSILKGEIHNDWVNMIKSSNPDADRQIVKEIRLNKMMPWLQKNFPDLGHIVIIVRDPYSVAYSATEMGWHENKKNKKDNAPEEFAKKHLNSEQLKLFTSPKSPFQKNLARWALDNYLLLSQTKHNENVLSVFYENLAYNPEEQFKRIAEFCEHTYEPLGKKATKKSQLARRSSVTKTSSKKFGRSWEGHITAEDEEYAKRLLKAFKLDTLYKERNVPNFAEPLEWQNHH